MRCEEYLIFILRLLLLRGSENILSCRVNNKEIKSQIQATTISNVTNKTNSRKLEITTNKMWMKLIKIPTRDHSTSVVSRPQRATPSKFNMFVSKITNERNIQREHTHVWSDTSLFLTHQYYLKYLDIFYTPC